MLSAEIGAERATGRLPLPSPPVQKLQPVSHRGSIQRRAKSENPSQLIHRPEAVAADAGVVTTVETPAAAPRSSAWLRTSLNILGNGSGERPKGACPHSHPIGRALARWTAKQGNLALLPQRVIAQGACDRAAERVTGFPMKIEKVRETLHPQPFRPFWIYLADGGRIPSSMKILLPWNPRPAR